jgi:hypothetical protein
MANLIDVDEIFPFLDYDDLHLAMDRAGVPKNYRRTYCQHEISSRQDCKCCAIDPKARKYMAKLPDKVELVAISPEGDWVLYVSSRQTARVRRCLEEEE